MPLPGQSQGLRESCFLSDQSSFYACFAITGNDRESFLQNLTSNDILKLPIGETFLNAILDKRSAIQALFWNFKSKDKIIIIAERVLIDRVYDFLDKMHFAEDLKFLDYRTTKNILVLQGSSATGVMARCSPEKHQSIPLSLTGDEGYFLLEDKSDTTGARLDITEGISEDDLNILRIEAGLLRYKEDYDENTLLLELGLGDKVLSFEKGCYPGQEVVARIHNLGEVKKKLIGLILRNNEIPKTGTILKLNGKKVGEIRSACYSPSLETNIAFAYLNKPYYNNLGLEYEFEAEDGTLKAEVHVLPFYIPEKIKEEAELEYDKGIQVFHTDDYAGAIAHFKKAVSIYDGHADAYEALGVALERNSELDAAITVNKKFAELHPTAFMAETNLSRLYMLKGLKEKAETAMAKSTMIQMRLSSKTAKQQKELVQKQEEAEKLEKARKLDIFKQVLEMDIEDEVANFGMGKYYLDAEEFENSLPHLKILVKNNALYSAAFDLLGKALVGAGNKEEAQAVLEQGIAVAEKQGDLQPLQRMQETLKKVIKN